MEQQSQVKLRFWFDGKPYKVDLTSSFYTERLVISKLKIGQARYWVILQNGNWHIIGEMPLCLEFKNILVKKIVAAYKLPAKYEAAENAIQVPVGSEKMLNTVLKVLASKKQIS